MKPPKLAMVSLGCVLTLLAGPSPDDHVVEFSEVSFVGANRGPFPLLTGHADFAPFLSFEDSAHLVTSPDLRSAGNDDKGVSTTQCPAGSVCFEANPTTSMTFVFSRGAASATFFWIATGDRGGSTSPVLAFWYDDLGNPLTTDVQLPLPTPFEGFISGQFSHTFPSDKALGKVTFMGNSFGRVGVGRIEFTDTFRGLPPIPDLVPTYIACPASANSTITVSVCNRSLIAAPASSTRITSFTYLGQIGPPVVSSTTVDTERLSPQQCTSMAVIAAGCVSGRCAITAVVNVGTPPITELDSTNNELTVTCVLPPRPSKGGIQGS